jgi:hypothetical protein
LQCRCLGGSFTRSHHYDIVRKDHDQSAIWLEAASDLRSAESRIAEFTSLWPGEFQIMDQQNHRVVETIIGPDRNKGRNRGKDAHGHSRYVRISHM